MRRLIAVLSLALSALPAAAQEAAPIPSNGGGEWIMLRYAYPAPPTGGSGIDYWISLDVYGSGPGADGIVRVRWVSPGEFNADMQPTRIVDVLQDFDCINRQQRNVDAGVPGDWYTLPDFVPGARTMFDVCSPRPRCGAR